MSVRRFEEVEFGDGLPSFDPDTGMENVRRFARAAQMTAARFTDHEGARKEGLAGAMVPGVMSQGILVAMIHRWAPEAEIVKIDTVFRAPVMVDERHHVSGVVTESMINVAVVQASTECNVSTAFGSEARSNGSADDDADYLAGEGAITTTGTSENGCDQLTGSDTAEVRVVSGQDLPQGERPTAGLAFVDNGNNGNGNNGNGNGGGGIPLPSPSNPAAVAGSAAVACAGAAAATAGGAGSAAGSAASSAASNVVEGCRRGGRACVRGGRSVARGCARVAKACFGFFRCVVVVV